MIDIYVDNMRSAPWDVILVIINEKSTIIIPIIARWKFGITKIRGDLLSAYVNHLVIKPIT